MWNAVQSTASSSSDAYLAAAWGSESNCVIVGAYVPSSAGVILSSTNGGKTFSRTLISGLIFRDVGAITNSGVLYYLTVASTGYVYSSINNGSTWSINANLKAYLLAVSVSSSDAVYIVGKASKIFRSSASSQFKSWVDISCSSYGTYQLNDVSSFNGVNVIVVGASGLVLTSSDAGTTWASRTSGTQLDIYEVSCANEFIALIAGADGYVARTSDAGDTWTRIYSVPSASSFKYHTLSMTNNRVVYLADNKGFIFRSLDSGQHWYNDSTVASSAGKSIFAVSMYSTMIGIAGDRYV